VSVAETCQRRGCGRAGGPRATERAQGGQGECGKHERGHRTNAEAQEGGGPQRGSSMVVLAHSSEKLRAIESGGGWLPQGKSPGPLDGGRGTTRARVDDGDVAATRKKSGEHGLREPEGEEVN
jgi:hypothetical protein